MNALLVLFRERYPNGEEEAEEVEVREASGDAALLDCDLAAVDETDQQTIREAVTDRVEKEI